MKISNENNNNYIGTNNSEIRKKIKKMKFERKKC